MTKRSKPAHKTLSDRRVAVVIDAYGPEDAIRMLILNGTPEAEAEERVKEISEKLYSGVTPLSDFNDDAEARP